MISGCPNGCGYMPGVHQFHVDKRLRAVSSSSAFVAHDEPKRQETHQKRQPGQELKEGASSVRYSKESVVHAKGDASQQQRHQPAVRFLIVKRYVCMVSSSSQCRGELSSSSNRKTSSMGSPKYRAILWASGSECGILAHLNGRDGLRSGAHGIGQVLLRHPAHLAQFSNSCVHGALSCS